MAITCIDIGTSKICTIIADVSDGSIDRILGKGEVASHGVQKGIIVDREYAIQAIAASVKEAQSNAPKEPDALVGFGGRHVESSNNWFDVRTRAKDNVVDEKVKEEVRREAEKVQFRPERERIKILERQYKIDDVAGVQNPVGMHGYVLKLEAHLVTAERSYMENLRDCVRAVDLEPIDVWPNPLASAKAVLEQDEMDRGVILADIGGGTTGIAVYREGRVWYTSGLPVGGRQVTTDLAVGLSIPFSAAEELKVTGGGLYPERDDAGKVALLEKYRTTPEVMSYMIRARVEEILRMVLSKPPQLPQLPKFLVLTGGTAKLPGMKQFVEDELGLQARIGVPGNLPEGADDLADPAYAAAVGLLLLGAQQREQFRRGGARRGERLLRFPFPLSRLWQGIRSRASGVIYGRPPAES